MSLNVSLFGGSTFTPVSGTGGTTGGLLGSGITTGTTSSTQSTLLGGSALTGTGGYGYGTLSGLGTSYGYGNQGTGTIGGIAPTPVPTPTPTPTPTPNDTSAPVFGVAPNNSLPEGTSLGTVVGSVSATDANPITYAITGGNTGNAFAINASSGQITLANTLDFETLNSYSLQITATDAAGNSATQSVTIGVTDEPEGDNAPPTFTNTSIATTPENAPIGGTIGTVVATDNVAVTGYSIVGGNSAGLFTIDSSGQIKVNAPLDYETAPALSGSVTERGYTLTIQAKDAAGNTQNASVVVGISDVYEAPNQPPVWGSAPSLSVQENQPVGTVVGTVAATDDKGVAAYAIVGGTGATLFQINSASGQITASSVVPTNDTGTMSYGLTLRATDAEGASADQTVTVSITDGPSSPTDPTPSNVLTTGEDDLTLTTGNDVVEGDSTTLGVEDEITDPSTADADSLNLELSISDGTVPATDPLLDVTNVENINIDWTGGVGTAAFDLSDVKGGAVTFNPTSGANLVDAKFNQVENVNLTMGDNFKGTLTLDDIEGDDPAGLLVDAGNASAIDVNNGDGKLVLKADAAKEIDIDAADELELNAPAVTALTLEADVESAEVTFGSDATAELQNIDDEAYKFSASAPAVVTLDDGTATPDVWTAVEVLTPSTLTLKGSQADLTGKTITNGGEIRVEATPTGALDVSKFEHSQIVFEGAFHSQTVSAKNGATFVAEASLGAGGNNSTFLTTAADDTSADVMSLTLKASQDGKLNFDDATAGNDEFEIVNLIADATGDLTLAAVTAADDTQVKISAASNDVEVTALKAKNTDASGVVENFKATTTASAPTAASILGAQGDNDVTFHADAVSASFVGQVGDDKVIFQNATSSAKFAADMGNGNNTVDASAMTGAAELSVVGGSGDDDVTAGGSIATGKVDLDLGDGDNTAKIIASDSGQATIDVVTGSGDDVVDYTAAASGDTDKVTLDLGAGMDQLNLVQATGDHSSVEFDVTGLEVLGLAGAATVGGDFLDGQSWKVTSNAGSAGHALAVKLEEAGTFDFSKLDIDDVADQNVSGLTITATGTGHTVKLSEGSDSYTGTAGVDTVYMNAGADAVALGSGDSQPDTVIFDEAKDAEAVTEVSSSNPATILDFIEDFDPAEDKIDLSVFNLTATGALGSAAASVTSGSAVTMTTISGLDVGDGEIATGQFTSGGGGGAADHTLVVFDADTSAGVELVGFVVDAAISVGTSFDLL